jgi:hypothetical protein
MDLPFEPPLSERGSSGHRRIRWTPGPASPGDAAADRAQRRWDGGIVRRLWGSAGTLQADSGRTKLECARKPIRRRDRKNL